MDNYNNSLNIGGGGGNSNYVIIRSPSKVEFDNLTVNTDLNGTLNSDFDVRKIDAWNYINYGNVGEYGRVERKFDNSTFQDNTNNTSIRFYWHSANVITITYSNFDKDFYTTTIDNYNVVSANFRPIIEYRE